MQNGRVPPDPVANDTPTLQASLARLAANKESSPAPGLRDEHVQSALNTLVRQFKDAASDFDVYTSRAYAATRFKALGRTVFSQSQEGLLVAGWFAEVLGVEMTGGSYKAGFMPTLARPTESLCQNLGSQRLLATARLRVPRHC